LDNAEALPTDDADDDGSNNLLGYALGTDPDDSTPLANPLLGLESDAPFTRNPTLTFTRHRSEPLYTVRGSENLMDWENLVTNPGTIGLPFTYPDEISSEPKRFLHLRGTILIVKAFVPIHLRFRSINE